MERPFLNCQNCCKWCVVRGCPYSTIHTVKSIATTQELIIKGK